jgi:hypothetical protein
MYDANGELTGGVKVTDLQAVGRVTDLVRHLYTERQGPSDVLQARGSVTAAAAR